MRAIARYVWMLNVLCIVGHCSASKLYPDVKPLQQTFDVPDVSKANVVLNINSIDGLPVYKLQCHVAGFTGDPDFDYSGDFECRLSSIAGGDGYSTLLTEDSAQSRDWESRGRFFAADLRNPCAQIPQFGATRSFELRGMDLTLQIIDPMFTDQGNLRSLKLVVKVRPNSNARREIADIVPLPKSGVPAECKLNENFIDQETFPRNQ
jgi:hypothetical protein